MQSIDGTEVTRLFTAGELHFVIATSHTEDRVLLEELFGDLPEPVELENGEVAAFAFLRDQDAGEPRWRVAGPRVSSDSTTGKLSVALTRLMSGLNVAALDAQPASLHLHAGAAVLDGRAVIVAAQRNTGKTTTIAHLIRRGWKFLTDETVALSSTNHDITGFPKPLSIKPGGDRHAEHLVSAMVPPLALDEPAFRFVCASASGAEIATSGAPHLVVLLSRDTESPEPPPVRHYAIHPADAVVKLMQETLDAERFGSAAVRLAELVARAHCFQIEAGSPEETADAIEALFELPPRDPAVVEQLPASSVVGAEVSTVRVDDRAVVHDLASGHIFAFDMMGTRVWEKLGGWAEHPDIDLSGPGVAPLVAQLEGLGVLGVRNG